MLPRPYDSLTRYIVDSESNIDEVHLIDLAANKFLGECSCQHFTLKIIPQIEENPDRANAAPEEFRCKHIKRVREYVLNHVIAAYENLSPKPNNE